MNHLFVMGVADHFGDLTHQVQLRLDTQLVSLLGQVVVQSHRERVVFKQQGRPQFVLGEVVRPENARMLQDFQDLGVAESGPPDRVPVFRGGFGADQVQPAFFLCNSDRSFFAFRLAAIKGLSSVDGLPSISQVQVPASPNSRPERLSISTRKKPWGVNSSESTSLMQPPAAMNSEFDQAR